MAEGLNITPDMWEAWGNQRPDTTGFSQNYLRQQGLGTELPVGETYHGTSAGPVSGAAPGIAATVGGVLGGPVGASILGLIGGGIGYYLEKEETDRKEREAKKQYQEQLIESRRRWEAQMAVERQRLGLSEKEFKEKMRQQRLSEKNYYDERNYTRAQDFQNRLISFAKNNRLVELWGRK